MMDPQEKAEAPGTLIMMGFDDPGFLDVHDQATG